MKILLPVTIVEKILDVSITVRKGTEGKEEGGPKTLKWSDLNAMNAKFIYNNIDIGKQCNIILDSNIAFSYGLILYDL